MISIVRLEDLSTGHGCFPPQTLCSGSPSVLTNSIPTGRQGDCYSVHCCCSIPTSHGGALASGRPNVLVNSKPIGYVGDPVTCGGSAATGSPNCF